MADATRVRPRQIWADPTTTTTHTYLPGCTPILLSSDGVIHVNQSFSLTLAENAVFEPTCTGDPSDYTHTSAVLDTRDPFYSSVTPQLYAIGCCTVVSYILVIILLITPRTFYVGGPGGGANFLSRHGMISSSYSGNSSVVGVGGRPWLQKVAAIGVAISLTIATADSFKVAKNQYEYGFSDAEALSQQVIDGREIRIVRIISQTFLWLAQVQTLIRLFPRHKEKVMIKWAGFALVVLDTLFSILENFWYQSTSTRPRSYDDAVSALSYLFELALNLLYAAWVIFYSISKHRYAFFHPKMRNICFVALLSLVAILIPVVFFVMDIARPEIAGWGTYIRWVGSAAASVVVWEWVERIEALERDETKDGILGREIFDGDEMLDNTPSEEVDWPRYSSHGSDGGSGNGASSGWGGVMGLAHRPLRTRVGISRDGGNRGLNSLLHPSNDAAAPRRQSHSRPTPPPNVITPVSRADTNSAASTVYNVRYHPVASPTPPVPMPHMEEEDEIEEEKEIEVEAMHAGGSIAQTLSPNDSREQSPQIVQTDPRWRTLLNPFKRRRASLPKEVASAQAGEEAVNGEANYMSGDEQGQERSRPATQVRGNHPFFSLHRKGPSAAEAGDASLPVTVIPARTRSHHTWTQQNQLLESASNLQSRSGPAVQSGRTRRFGRSDRGNLPVQVIPLPTVFIRSMD
ncbi:hypothetical protein N7468_001633 [Penicillium chermesinum]|uniref:PH signal transduction protein PalH n=1 Tax=Penicillium chermesinum TaxID=63820 RepID=A0A9W9PH01_9EURO|nr:uncharacterized protein N7468_001633 [Penicillium chermesinum]KAJ5246650.1 hypothetical protein N7468_001633 [Penicillium chermesinum]